jgi:hypothetical protein
MNLPRHRRPPDLQDVGKDPVWCIEDTELGPDLVYRRDPAQQGRGFIEPARPMLSPITKTRWRNPKLVG